MKLIVAGGTGLVATEVIRQSLRMSEITSVVVLARKPINIGDGTKSSKLETIIIKDYGVYPDEVKQEFVGADACIWYKFQFLYKDLLTKVLGLGPSR